MIVLTFEVGPYLLAAPSSRVERIVGADDELPEGTTIVDTLGLLGDSGGGAGGMRPGCMLLLTSEGEQARAVAVTASAAGEICSLAPERMLPLPAFMFRRENPFLGLVPPGGSAGGRPLFVLAGPERLLACAGEL